MCASGSGRRAKVTRLAVLSQKEGEVGHKNEHVSFTTVNTIVLEVPLNRTHDGKEEVCSRRK